MKHKKLFVFLLFTILTAPAWADEEVPVELPPITVVAPTTDGGNILCQGAGCWVVLMSLQGAYTTFDNYVDFIGKIEPAQVDRSKFCSNLKRKQPSHCRLGNIPSTPVFDPGWQPNGCGTGLLTNTGLRTLLSFTYNYFNTLDEPYRGVSFEESCNGHDRCFSSAGGFDNCNDLFFDDMAGACKGGTTSGSSARSACTTFAHAYRAAVATDRYGADAYAEAVANLTCAGWYKAMKMNRCS